jgi:hypothetical protein
MTIAMSFGIGEGLVVANAITLLVVLLVIWRTEWSR